MVTPADWWCFSTGTLMILFTCLVTIRDTYDRRMCGSFKSSPGLTKAISMIVIGIVPLHIMLPLLVGLGRRVPTHTRREPLIHAGIQDLVPDNGCRR